MKITIQKTFETRPELDTFIANTFGEDPEKNRQIVIETDRDTLEKLALSEDTKVHGVRFKEVSVEDSVSEDSEKAK